MKNKIELNGSLDEIIPEIVVSLKKYCIENGLLPTRTAAMVALGVASLELGEHKKFDMPTSRALNYAKRELNALNSFVKGN